MHPERRVCQVKVESLQMSKSAAGAPPTMADVAAAAGVSKALVSIVFRGAAGASDATRARVFQAAEQLGYRTNRTASLLKLHRTRHLGVTMNVRNAFHAELVEAIQGAADREGYQIVLSTVTGSHDERRAIETLLEFRCESLILLGSELGKPTLDDLAASVPVVLVGRRVAMDSVDVVRTADDKGLGLVVDHLVAFGHNDIAHIDGGRHTISADRRRGYRRAMRRRHEDRHVRILTGGSSEADGWRAADQLLHLDQLPTAVTTFNDHCAVGVIDRFARAGVAIPGEVSVAGYDNAPIAQFAAINLTTVSQEAPTQAQWAVRAAVERLEGVRHDTRESILEPRLIVRGSTGPVRADVRSHSRAGTRTR
jgi:DNA-binding LacI/PurR family transcriptional regulator